MKAKAITPQWCVYPGCQNTRRTRGLCHGHYQTMRDRVRKGLADEADLERRGLLLPKGTGGSPVITIKDSEGRCPFTLGSTIVGQK
ncbi:MAG: hypothetical protein KJO40_13615 [Deltaproteobacteria bacterium]|nr:hypothetical protein [Deltaproteobacteria bacterium]